MKQRLVLGGLALAAIGLTCGGDGSTFSSGVNKDAELGSLSSGDVQKVCESLHTWMQENLLKVVKEMSCRTQGFGAWVSGSDSATQKQTACTMAYDQCMKQPTEASEPAMCDDKPSAACKATVGELESCFNGLIPVMRQVLEGFPTCAQIGSGAMPYPPGNLQPPAACKSLESKCPEWELPSAVDLATEP
jgi:hypothetical protein